MFYLHCCISFYVYAVVLLSHGGMGWSVVVAFSVHTHQVLAVLLDSYLRASPNYLR